MTAFDPRTREYTVQTLALYSRPQIKITEGTVVAPFRDGNEEMYSRGGACNSEGAKASGEATRRATELWKQVMQLQFRTECAEKKARVKTGKVTNFLRGKFRRHRRRIFGALLEQLKKLAASLPGPCAGKVAERESSKRSRAGDAAGRGGRAGSGAGSAAGEEK